ncbi:MAG: hypothetical protein DRH04_05245 [Deltaproteobacteria bacterium]|nr:MAG: hypothetical protein DRH04_05245 [Deltaproteobacteria bacterium]
MKLEVEASFWVPFLALALVIVTHGKDHEASAGELGGKPAELKRLEFTELGTDRWGFRTLDNQLVKITNNRNDRMLDLEMWKWGEDSMRVRIPTYTIATVRSSGNKGLSFASFSYDVDFRPREKTVWRENILGEVHEFVQNEDGGVEFDIVLRRRPPTNRWVFLLDAENFEFYYQPPLHPDHPTWADEDNDGTPDSFRPMNVVGSYAVYHKWKANNEYRTGKAFHIYRPHVTDARGNETWADLRIENGVMTVTVDREWLNNATYPVRIDPNFGYESVGGSYYQWYGKDGGIILGSWFTLSESGTADSISVYFGSGYSDADGTYSTALYYKSNNSYVPNSGSENQSPATGGDDAWTTFNLPDSPSLSATDYWIVVWARDMYNWYYVYFRYDGESDKGGSQGAEGGNWPNTISLADNDMKLSIYCTYTAGGVQPAWNQLETWDGTASNPQPSWDQIETWSGFIGWWNSNWEYRREITIDHTKIDSDLENFPVLVHLTSSNFDFAHVSFENGQDIRFIDDGNELDYEIEYFSKSNESAWVHVRIPSVSSSADTTFYIYYGNASAGDGQNASGVWDANFKGVWHLEEGTGTTAGDSTSNAKDGTLQGNMTWTDAGKTDGAVVGPGDTSSYVSFPSDTIESLSALTVEAWINTDTTDTTEDYAGKANKMDYAGEWVSRRTSSNTIYFSTRTNPNNVRDDLYSSGTVTTGWHYVVCRWDGSTGKKNIFIDGNKDSNESTVGDSMPSTSYTLYLARGGSDTSVLFDGKLDEYRISSSARSDAWIKATYHSGSDNLLSVGNEEEKWTPVWNQIETWSGTVSAPLTGDWNQVETWSGSVSSPAYWNQLETWSGDVSSPAYWNQIESWNGNVTQPAGFNQIETWNGAVQSPANWNQIESWSGSVGSPANWNQIETWTGTVVGHLGWNQLETWSGAVESPANWNQIESWVGTVESPAEWNQIEAWSGSALSPAYWNQIETWGGQVESPAGWNQLDDWSATASAPAYWDQIETWTGSATAHAGWNQIEAWWAAVTSPANWNQIETWSGSASAPVFWNQLESWSGTVTSPAYWNQVESWSGSVKSPAHWNQIESWNGTVSGPPPANWDQLESWIGDAASPAYWNQLDAWSGSVGTPAGWGIIDAWAGTVTAPVEIAKVVIKAVTVFPEAGEFRVEWENVENATSYHIQIDNDNQFLSPFEHDNADIHDNCFTAPLRDYRVYIRVCGVAGDTEGEWSEVFTFNLKFDLGVQHLGPSLSAGAIAYLIILAGVVGILLGIKHRLSVEGE